MGQCKDFFVPLHANMFLIDFAAFGACALLLTDGLVACASALQKIKKRALHTQRGTKETKRNQRNKERTKENRGKRLKVE